MVVAFSTDKNYVKQLCVCLYSLYKCNSNDISVIVIDCGLQNEDRKLISDVSSKFDGKVRFVTLKELTLGSFLTVDNSMSIATYARLFLCNLNEYDKIIYMDCDGVIKGSLEPLWNTDITDNYVAGVLDNMNPQEKSQIGLNQEDNYINSGVLLMNLKKMREDNWIKSVNSVIEEYKGSVPKHDQGVINIICKNRKILLKPRFNAMPQYLVNKAKDMKPLFGMNAVYTEEDFKEAKNKPIFVHSTNFYDYRIWDKKSKNPFKDYYNLCVSESGIDSKSYITNVKRNIPMEISRFFIFSDLIIPFVIIRTPFIYFRNLLRKL